MTATGSGYLRVNPPDTPCAPGGTCLYHYVSGTTVTLTAETGPSYEFDGWSGDCTGTTPTCTLNMTANKTVEAHFSTRSFALSLSLAVEPGASGRVTSNPPGIDCPGDCSESYVNETFVTLTAAPGTGSVFAGWNSPWCMGLGPCVIGMGAVFAQDKAVTAAFAVAR